MLYYSGTSHTLEACTTLSFSIDFIHCTARFQTAKANLLPDNAYGLCSKLAQRDASQELSVHMGQAPLNRNWNGAHNASWKMHERALEKHVTRRRPQSQQTAHAAATPTNQNDQARRNPTAAKEHAVLS